ncbi:MAG: pentapeptide repeat-containing protein [Anaerolineales bacterium]|nr:pentapeptide repeat-containing protein [Anaerolineales bacterium]
MSEYTREEILRLIEENGGPEGLDLSGKDLSGIDLSSEAIEAELEKAQGRAPNETPVWLRRTWAGESTNLDSANLQGVNLDRANLRGAWLFGADLREADLGGANLQGAILEWTNLHGASLHVADLQGASLGGANLQEADLRRANLQEAYLWHAKLQQADLWRAKLQQADLSNSHLEKVDFFVAEGLEGAYFYQAFLDGTRMRREQLGGAIGEELEGKYDEAKEAYLALKNNFAEIGRYDDAAWAYRKERRMEKMCSAPGRAREFYGESQLKDTWDLKESKWKALPVWHPRVLWFYTRHTLKWLADWFVELLCGYGESIWRVLAWMVFVIVGFAAYYQVTHAVVTSSQDAATSLWDHLIFSLGAFTTLQPARLQAARPGVELLTTIQAIIGISLAGLLGFVAGNRIRRS